MASINEQRFITLANRTTGTLYSLNFPQPLPYDVDYTQHLIAPLGEVILLELYGVGFSQYGCRDTGFIEVKSVATGLSTCLLTLSSLPLTDLR